MNASPLLQLLVDRGESPWQGYTATAQEEEDGRHVAAVVSTAGLDVPPRLTRYQDGGLPWLAVDRTKRAVVVLASVFGNLKRVDVTRLPQPEVRTLGTVTPALAGSRARDVVVFLLESQVIQTFIHMEAELRLEREEETPAAYAAHFTGVHRFYTNKKNERALAFVVRVEKNTGAISVTGGG